MPSTKLVLFAAILASACDKPNKASDTVAIAGSAAPDVHAAAAAAPPAPPVAALPALESTGVLDLQLQTVPGADGAATYRLLSPRFSVDFPSRPALESNDLPIGDDYSVTAAVASIFGDTGLDMVFYMPIPKGPAYKVETILKRARGAFLKSFDPGYQVTDEPATLGPFEAQHLTGTGVRKGTKMHFETWIAWDAAAATLCTVSAWRRDGDTRGVTDVMRSFKLRDGQAVGAPPAAAPPASTTPKAKPTPRPRPEAKVPVGVQLD
jgi:hypothetical protein